MKRILALVIIFLTILPFTAAQENIADEDHAATVSEPVIEQEATDVAQEPHKTDETPVILHAETAIETLEEKADTDTHTMGAATRLGIALAIIAVQALLIWLVWHLFKRLSRKIEESGGDKIKPLTIKKLKILSAKQIISVILFFLRILKYVVTALQLFLTMGIVFYLFPTTRKFAMILFDHILSPLQKIGIGIIDYLPNLIPIILFIVITRYVLKGLKFFAVQITRGKLVIAGFYAEWAAPTYKILQVLLIAFTIALIYPYLPGSDSDAFKGVSVFVGIIFTLGSTSAIGNMVAGLVITYMRPFKIGDRVKINDSTGFVVEKNMMVVRLKTHKNEYITFPNLTVLSSGITNYNTSSDEDEEGLILNTEITIGYATPWETVHQILIDAALATDHVQKRPKPFALQTSLDDYYARYQINCYTKEVEKVPQIYAQLYENIQNGFHEAGLDLTSPHYRISRVEK